ncbi:hypothetical protein MKX01_032178 [Papaver californicum]|nr:hypothetical protein MKX01_032178 [Papaver californicum]
MHCQILLSRVFLHFSFKTPLFLILFCPYTNCGPNHRFYRGMSRGIKLERLLQISNDGKLSVNLNEAAGQPVYINRSKLATECGGKFWVDLSVPYIWSFVHMSMGKRYSSHRGLMSKYFKETGSSNREKVQYNHCNGSMAFIVCHEMITPLSKYSLRHIKVIDKVTKEQIWLSDEARSRYDKMIEIKQQDMEEGSKSRDEKDICVEVLEKKRKRRHVIAMQSNEETEELREKVRQQDEQIKQMKEDHASFKQDMLNCLGLNLRFTETNDQ